MENTKTFYFVNSADKYDAWFGAENPACIDMRAIQEFSRGWGIPVETLMEDLHEADEDEIAQYGIYEW